MIGIRHAAGRAFAVIKRVAPPNRLLEPRFRLQLRSIGSHQQNPSVILQIKRDRLTAACHRRRTALPLLPRPRVSFAVRISLGYPPRPLLLYAPRIMHTRRARQETRERLGDFGGAFDFDVADENPLRLRSGRIAHDSPPPQLPAPAPQASPADYQQPQRHHWNIFHGKIGSARPVNPRSSPAPASARAPARSAGPTSRRRTQK